MVHFEPEIGGPVPQTPWDFPLLGRGQKRPTEGCPTAGPEGYCPLHGPALRLRPRRALFSEPQKQDSNRQMAVLRFSRFHDAPTAAHAQKTTRFYILTMPFRCPAHGERLSS